MYKINLFALALVLYLLEYNFLLELDSIFSWLKPTLLVLTILSLNNLKSDSVWWLTIFIAFLAELYSPFFFGLYLITYLLHSLALTQIYNHFFTVYSWKSQLSAVFLSIIFFRLTFYWLVFIDYSFKWEVFSFNYQTLYLKETSLVLAINLAVMLLFTTSHSWFKSLNYYSND